MIDLHCHILPGIDDGADSPETSRQMVDAAAEQGIDLIVATSHYSTSGDAGYDKAFENLAEYAAGRGVKLLPGMEYDYDRLSEIPDEKLRTVGNGGYVLVDLKQPYVSGSMDQLFFNLRLRGRKIIVAHPERLWEMNFRENLAKLSGAPVLQFNCGSFLGRYGKHVCRAAWAMLQECPRCMIAGDAHKVGGICAKRCMELLKEYFPAEAVEIWMTENPRRVISGEDLKRTVVKLDFKRRLKLQMALLTGKFYRR